MRFSHQKRTFIAYSPRTVTIATLAFLGLLILAFAAFQPGSSARDVIAGVAYSGSAVLATFVLGRAAFAAEGRERFMGGLLAGGLLLRFAGDLAWLLLWGSASGYALLSQAIYVVSYLLLFGGLLCLVSLMTNRIAPITALDAITIVLSVGSLIYFFVLDRSGAGLESWQETLSLLIHPSFDAALLFLGLVTLATTRHASFTGFLTLGFLVFLLADAVYLSGTLAGPYDPGGWSGMFFAAGTLLLGLGALYVSVGFVRQASIEPWRVFSFWLSPLSPPVQYAVLLVWGVFYPPLPTYVYAIGAFILLCMASRVALVSFITGKNTRDREDSARRGEQNRLLRDLHETTKQDVHGVSLALGSATEAERRGDRHAVQKSLDRAFRLSREAEYRISRPFDDLRDSQSEEPVSPDDYLRGRLAKFEEYFGVKTHADFRAPLDALSQAEVAAVNRFVVEACWNVAKHSKANNLYLESRRVGRILIVRVRDDGRGFDPKRISSGMGLQYIRLRAAEVGASLDVISYPVRGTTVQLRFEKR